MRAIEGSGFLARIGAPITFVVIWSSAYVAIRAGLPDVSPLFFLSIRFALASALLLAAVVALRQAWPEFAGVWKHLVVAGLLINGLYLSAGYLALQHINAATMALIAALHPLLTAALARPLLDEAMRPLQWGGLGLGMAGVVMVVGEKATQVESVMGALIGFAGVVCLALGTIHYRKHCRDVNLVAANAIQISSACVFCALLTLGFEDVRVTWSPRMLFTLVYLATVASLGAMALLMFMLRRGHAGKVASNFYLVPGTTAVLGWLILGESLSGFAIAGLVVASLGVWLAHRDQPTSESSSDRD